MCPMKKILLLFAICCFAACDNINKEELKEEIVAELKSASTHYLLLKALVPIFMQSLPSWVVLVHALTKFTYNTQI